MRRWVQQLITWAGLALLTVTPALAAGEKADAIVIVADSRRFTGWRAWWTNLYNESHLYFAIATVILIPLVGALLGVLADLVMARIGINLRSRELAEH
ncbi:MAG: hypothetical protein FJW34_13120 [Acidobacteria bacterium]|nr:hypothetical protein [Acidobacteriota bacterium]